MAPMSSAYERLRAHLRETAVLSSCSRILGWDRETYLPQGATGLRADQTALLARLAHERRTSPALRDLLAEAREACPERDSPRAANLREAQREFDRATRIPAALIEERARLTTLARQAWLDARAKRQFGIFLPWLGKIVQLCRDEAEALDPPGEAYDAHLDEYEPGATAKEIEAVLSPLRDALAALLRRVLGSGQRLSDAPVRGDFPVEGQRRLSGRVLEAIGFDFSRGRTDLTAHAFCGGMGPFDVRLSSRFDPGFLVDGFFGTLHEGGHGLYEQGLDPDEFGMPCGTACSLGVHESQSRLWENLVGRSRAFWRHFLPAARKEFPDALRDVTPDALHGALNGIQPTFIRVDADELTYNLHICLRFDLERALLSGDLDATDLPQAWNDGFERLLGIRPAHDADGCLQDIHWSAGLVGYFPTYTLGNLYGAQIFERAREELGDLDAAFARGEFLPLRDWLREKIYRHGMRYPAKDLVARITGNPPSPRPLLTHLERRCAELYG